jgi:hypothetical protein|tara:strand:- start:749 stop:1006 length:258 start_codon:yes stop_codon:yes gene_type:complete
MAKRKTPKVADLRPDSITNEQLIKLQGIVKAINTTQAEIGMLESRKHNLLHQVFEFQQVLSKFQTEIKEQYGTDEINISDGKISY